MKVKVHFTITRWIATFNEVLEVPDSYDYKLLKKELNKLIKSETITHSSRVKEIFLVEELVPSKQEPPLVEELVLSKHV